jgi:hypothetical protein
MRKANLLNKVNELYVRERFEKYYKSLNILDFLNLEETLFNFYKAGFDEGYLQSNEIKKELITNNLQLQAQILTFVKLLDDGQFFDKIVLEALKTFCTHSIKCNCSICTLISNFLLEELSNVSHKTYGSFWKI